MLPRPARISGESAPPSGLAVALASAFVFSCFFPFPAIDIGNSTGLQISHIFALVMLPFIALHFIPRRQVATLGILVFVATLSACVAVLSGPATDGALASKAVVEIALALLVLIPMGWIIRRVGLTRVLPAVAAALIVQALVGLDQVVQFQSNQFPLLFLYHNASFKFSTQLAFVFAAYEKRPFGVFPEPSAMVASIGPWFMLLLSGLLYPSIRTARRSLTRALLWLGALAGGGLIALSRGGDSAIVAGCAVALVLGGIRSSRRSRSSGRSKVAITAAGVALVTTIGGTILQLTQRLQIETGLDPAWLHRLTSVTGGLALMGQGLRQLLFGVGPGQSEALIISTHVNPEGAIDSLSAGFIVGCGALGAFALLVVLMLVVRAIRRSSARAVGYVCLVTWLGSVALTTSYLLLSPIWIFLAVLLEWDRIFAPAYQLSQGMEEANRTADAHGFGPVRRGLPAAYLAGR